MLSPRKRCPWATSDPLYLRYHDEEWGAPVHDDLKLFEMLTLEGAQAGLSWITILRRREGYRRAFAGFDPAEVARFTEATQAKLLSEEGIIRNRAKIASAVKNAQAFLRVQEERGSFDAYLWSWVQGVPIQGARHQSAEVPAKIPLAQQIAKDLKTRGFSFVGPTIVYAFMQAIGIVNDHLLTCFRARELGG